MAAVAALTAALQSAPAAPPAPAPAATPCVTGTEQPLGPLGRARIVAFEAALSRARVCALVVNLALDRIRTSVGPAAADATVLVSLGSGTGAALTARADGAPTLDPGTPAAGARAVGPLLLAPGGTFVPPADVPDAPRTLLAYADNRLYLIFTGPMDVADLVRTLRDRGDAFGADAAFERAAVLDAGPAAALWARTADGTLGRLPAGGDVLSISPR